MTELLEHYQQQAQSALTSLPWLSKEQQQAQQALAEYGFPTRHDEDWKYTRVDAWLEKKFHAGFSGQKTTAPVNDLPCESAIVINGHDLSGIEQLNLPQGMIICSIREAAQNYPELFEQHFNQSLKTSHGFQAWNTAMVEQGLFIYAPQDCQPAEPLLLSHWQAEAGRAINLRHLIVLESGAELTLIEDYRGATDCEYLTNTLTEIQLYPKARLTHYKTQRESKAAAHIGHIAVSQSAGSEFNSHLLNLGGQLVRSDLHILLQEEGARCLMNGIYVPVEGQHVDQHTTVEHRVPHCRSEQDYKGVLKGKSRAVFNGKVLVEKYAQKTEAHQQNKNLLLSSQAEIDTKPQLEIFADDVICSHGATVGQLDEDALFYLAARGIDKAQASAFLIQAFAADNINMMPDKKIAEWAADLVHQQLR